MHPRLFIYTRETQFWFYGKQVTWKISGHGSKISLINPASG